MRKYIYSFFVCEIIIVLLLVSIKSCKIDKYTPSQNNYISEERSDQKSQMELDYMDTTAIGNIHLNTSKEVFEQERSQFLKETKTLGELKIKSVTGFFYDNRLAAIQIISYPQTAHKNGRFGMKGWEYLYDKKYRENYSSNKGDFQYIKGRKGIKVTDLCASDCPYSSFKELMEKPLKKTYMDEMLFPPIETMGNIDGPLKVLEVLEYLPQSRKNYYQKLLMEESSYNNINSLSVPDYQRIYNAARNEANNIIQQQNNINSLKHKNDPSWSVIIISFIPACDKFEKEKKKVLEQKEQDEQKELEKI